MTGELFVIEDWWYPEQQTPGSTSLARYRCPACGYERLICSPTHRIDKGGTVTPSAVCAFPGCTFHKYIVLKGWPTPPMVDEDGS